MRTSIFVFGFVLFMAQAAGAIPPFLELREPLGLSVEQVAKSQEIDHSLKKSIIKKEADLKIAEIELQEMLESKDVNLAEVRTKLENISKLQTEIKYLDIKATEDAKKILTPEQLGKFKNLPKPGFEPPFKEYPRLLEKFRDLPRPPMPPEGCKQLEQMRLRAEDMSRRAMEMYKDHQSELQKRLDEIQKMLDTLKRDLEKK